MSRGRFDFDLGLCPSTTGRRSYDGDFQVGRYYMTLFRYTQPGKQIVTWNIPVQYVRY